MKVILRKEAKSAGLTHYYTGLPCKHGHVDKRWTCNAMCFSCHYNNNPLLNLKPKTDLEKKEMTKIRAKNWYKKNKQKTIDRAAAWKKDNREAVRNSEKRWRAKDDSKAIIFMRDCLRRVLKTEKNGRTEVILGYTRRDLVSHIESQFLLGMTWGNHGKWHIDHITPVSLMLKDGIKCPKKINCLSNLMPVWAEDNLKNNAKRKFLI